MIVLGTFAWHLTDPYSIVKEQGKDRNGPVFLMHISSVIVDPQGYLRLETCRWSPQTVF